MKSFLSFMGGAAMGCAGMYVYNTMNKPKKKSKSNSVKSSNKQS